MAELRLFNNPSLDGLFEQAQVSLNRQDVQALQELLDKIEVDLIQYKEKMQADYALLSQKQNEYARILREKSSLLTMRNELTQLKVDINFLTKELERINLSEKIPQYELKLNELKTKMSELGLTQPGLL